MTDADTPRRGITRRQLLFGAAATAGVVAVDQQAKGPLTRALFDEPMQLASDTYSTTFLLRRREDFLNLELRLVNLTVVPGTPTQRLVRVNPSQPGILVFDLGSQHLDDQAPQEVGAPPGPNNIGKVPILPAFAPPLEHRLAEPSRLAFVVPSGMQIPVTSRGLLDWDELIPNVISRAWPNHRVDDPIIVPPGDLHRAPNENETSIEVPYRMVISPSELGRWVGRVVPHFAYTRTALWTAHLRVAPGYGNDERIVRTVHYRSGPDPVILKSAPEDAHKTGLGDPLDKGFVLAMDEGDIENLYEQTGLPIGGKVPQAIKANRLSVSALGASTDLEAKFAAGDIADFRLRSELGRTNFAKVVTRGFLMPFGHRATFTTTTIRNPYSGPDGSPNVAYLIRRDILQIQEQVRDFSAEPLASLQPDQGRGCPFTRVEILVERPPPVIKQSIVGVTMNNAYWIGSGSGRFQFPVRVTDHSGRVQEFQMPMAFVEDSVARFVQSGAQNWEDENPTNVSFQKLMTVIAAYNAEPDARIPAHRRRITIAPETHESDATFTVDSFKLGAAPGVGTPAHLPQVNDYRRLRQPAFFPIVQSFDLELPSAGPLGAGARLVPARYDEVYLASAFNAVSNASKLLLQFVTPTPSGAYVAAQEKLPFPSERTGALVNLSFAAESYSPSLGVMGGRERLMAARFNPADVFGGMEGALLLGSFTFGDIANEVPLTKAMRTYDRVAPDGTVTTRMEWSTDSFKKTDRVTFGNNASLDVVGELGAGKSDIRATLDDFTLFLLDDGIGKSVELGVTRFSYRSVGGGEPTIELDVHTVEFHGPLRFVRELAEFLNPGNGFDVGVTAKALEVSVGVTLPSLQMGVFTLANLSFNVKLRLPLVGEEVTFQFGVGKPSSPFTLTVGPFGGTGYLLAEFGAGGGAKSLEAQLTFGARCQLDIGIASGAVYLEAGIFFAVAEDYLNITGFLRMGGALDVMGLVNLSVEFYMGLSYVQIGDKDKVKGRASVTVEVDVVGLGGSVTLEAEKKFGNAPEDPTFADQMDPAHWQSYCGAFT